MIEFLTLFLGLTIGPQDLELNVTPPVAAVEIRVDDRAIARLDAPPWRLGLDFGDRLVPQRLSAVGFDTSGKEIGRVTQNINFGRSNHEAHIVLLGGTSTRSRQRGRVVWRAPIQDQKPKNIEVRLDGAKLDVNADGYFDLPAQNDDAVHLLEAEVTFPPLAWTDSRQRVPLPSSSGYDFEGSLGSRQAQRPTHYQTEGVSTLPAKTVHADLVFGRLHGQGAAAALTAIPAQLVPGFELPAPEEMRDWLADGEGGQPLPVFSIGAEPGGLVVVYDHDLRKDLAQMVKRLGESIGQQLPLGVRPEHSMRFVAAQPKTFGNAVVYPSYEPPQAQIGKGLLDVLADPPTKPKTGRQPSFLWDSVALAGRRAAQTNQVRAVVVIFDTDPKDQSALVADQACAYLAALRVPLFLWTPTPKPALDVERSGASRYIGETGLLALADDLGRALDRQRILWVEGEPLPQRVRLTSEAPRTLSLIGPG